MVEVNFDDVQEVDWVFVVDLDFSNYYGEFGDVLGSRKL